MEQFEKVCKGLEELRNFADTKVHPIVSPENWGVYSDLCDLIDEFGTDALALIRQQRERIKELEAARAARVMTLEEVKGSEVVYLEDFSDPDDGVEPIIRPAVNIEAKNGGIVMLDSATWDEGFIFVVDSEYGKRWRCWTFRPTDEQREATQWAK